MTVSVPDKFADLRDFPEIAWDILQFALDTRDKTLAERLLEGFTHEAPSESNGYDYDQSVTTLIKVLQGIVDRRHSPEEVMAMTPEEREAIPVNIERASQLIEELKLEHEFRNWARWVKAD